MEEEEHLDQGPWKKLVPAESQESCGFNAGGNMEQICGGRLWFHVYVNFLKKKPKIPNKQLSPLEGRVSLY